MSPILYLIPTPLGAPDTPCLLTHEQAQITGLTDFVVEAEKTARAHLKHLGITTPIRELNLQTLNEHTDLKTLPELLKPLQEGRSMGILSEAGCPAVADPGANLVALVHRHGYEVRPLVELGTAFAPAKRNPAFHRNALPQRRVACRRTGNPAP